MTSHPLLIDSLAFAAGLLAGFIDSMAGGGGLITVPTLAIMLKPGVEAIASNKIAGLTSSLVALLVFARRGKSLYGHTFDLGSNFALLNLGIAIYT